MTVPLVLELKKMLSNVLSSDKIDLRKKGMEDSMELMTQLNMDIDKAEEFLKIEDIEKGNKIVEELLQEVDKLEYASDKEIKDINKEHIDSSEE